MLYILRLKKKKFHRFNPYLSFNSYAQAFNLFEDKLTNTKFINFFLEEFFFFIFKKKISLYLEDALEVLHNKFIFVPFLSRYLPMLNKLRIRKNFFLLLLISAWVGLLKKNSYFFTKFFVYGLKTRKQSVFLKFIRFLILNFFTNKINVLKPQKFKTLKGIRIGLFGKLFGRRRSKKLYIDYFIEKTWMSSLSFKNFNFTFLKSWTYYGAFGVKVWFFL